MSNFTKYDLEHLTTKILVDNPNKFFSQDLLYKEVSNFYQNNMSELFFGHFLLIWQKLLENTNHVIINDNMIKYKEDTTSDIINHMKKYPKLYQGYELSNNNHIIKFNKKIKLQCPNSYYSHLYLIPVVLIIVLFFPFSF